jgi:molybdate/tungstate transport system substrate-binding protein
VFPTNSPSEFSPAAWLGHSLGLTLRNGCAAIVALSLLAAEPAESQAGEVLRGELVVFNAGSLAVPFHRLLELFGQRYPGVSISQENSGSLAAVRKVTALGRSPDILALADRTLFSALLEPRYVTWHLAFARNSMVLAVSPMLASSAMPLGDSWPDSLLLPGVRWGFADPEIDPAGYRTLMVFDLAERYYQRPGLAAQLRDRADPRYQRPKSVDLVTQLQLGEIDYAWLYASVASHHGLSAVELPPAVNLGDEAFADTYRSAVVTVPGRSSEPGDHISVAGSPIELGLSIPNDAPHPAIAEAFVRLVVSPEGQSILQEVGFGTVEPPIVAGTPPTSLFRTP